MLQDITYPCTGEWISLFGKELLSISESHLSVGAGVLCFLKAYSKILEGTLEVMADQFFKAYKAPTKALQSRYAWNYGRDFDTSYN